MPSQNSIKKYVEKGVYHVYNRGINADTIFRNKADYDIALDLLNKFLGLPNKDAIYLSKNFNADIKLYFYCIMPNHFHLVLEQSKKDSMQKFMQSFLVALVMRINKKYRRIGHLFQDRYKARLINTDEDFLNISSYVHNNPKDIYKNVFQYPYSSARFYTKPKTPHPDYLYTDKLLSYFSNPNLGYCHFLHNYIS